MEILHQVINEKFNETFKGNLEEKTIKTKSTGRFSNSNIFLS